MDKYIGFDIDDKHTVSCIVEKGKKDRFLKFKTDIKEMRNYLRQQKTDNSRIHLTFEISGQAGHLYDSLQGYADTIWSTPKIKLAKEFGISDVGLGKICKRHNIPKPGLGYWAKLEHGKAVKKIHLPESENGDYEIIITAFERPEIKTQDSNPEQITQADLLIRKINSDQDSVVISASPENAHKLVLRAQRSLRNAPKDDLHILKPRIEKCLPIHVSSSSLNQALLIMDSLIKLLDKYELSINPENLHQIDVLGNPISFGLYESHDRKERELTKKEREEQERYSWRRTYPQYTYTPNGKLSLKSMNQPVPQG